MKKIKQEKSGISLIVLVITIIVMIILAAAIILSLDGSNIIGRAKGAKNASDIATAKEIVALAKSEWAFEKVDGYDSAKEYAEAKLLEAGYKLEGNGGLLLSSTSNTINTIYIGSDNRQAIIPEGFTVSIFSTEDTVTEGLVIYDATVSELSTVSHEEAMEKYNQFVWVPVPDMTNFKRTYSEKNGNEPAIVVYRDLDEYPPEEITLSLTNDLTGEYAEYKAMTESVEKYGGFYIGRYEAGTTTERKGDLSEGTSESNGTTDVLVQKDKFVYNWVGWASNPITVIGDIIDLMGSNNQGKGAVELSRNLYESSDSVVSTLCYNVQWDVALQFIAEKDADYPTNNDEKGNFTNTVEKTGYYAANNIYDMGGNIQEWNMAGEYDMRTIRSSWEEDPTSPLTSASTVVSSIVNDAIFGFRIALYII